MRMQKVGCVYRAEEDEAVVVWGDPEPRGHGRTDIQSTERICFFSPSVDSPPDSAIWAPSVDPPKASLSNASLHEGRDLHMQYYQEKQITTTCYSGLQGGPKSIRSINCSLHQRRPITYFLFHLNIEIINPKFI